MRQQAPLQGNLCVLHLYLTQGTLFNPWHLASAQSLLNESVWHLFYGVVFWQSLLGENRAQKEWGATPKGFFSTLFFHEYVHLYDFLSATVRKRPLISICQSLSRNLLCFSMANYLSFCSLVLCWWQQNDQYGESCLKLWTTLDSGKAQPQKLMATVLQRRSWREVPSILGSMFSVNLHYPLQGKIQYEWHNLDFCKAGISL